MDKKYFAIAVRTAIAAVAISAILPAFAERRPMALVIMTDGLRADTVASGRMPNLEKLRAGKDDDTTQHGYECEVCDAGLKLIPPPGFSIILR